MRSVLDSLTFYNPAQPLDVLIGVVQDAVGQLSVSPRPPRLLIEALHRLG